MADLVTIGGKPASVLVKVAHMRMGDMRRRDLFAEAFRAGLAPLGVTRGIRVIGTEGSFPRIA